MSRAIGRAIARDHATPRGWDLTPWAREAVGDGTAYRLPPRYWGNAIGLRHGGPYVLRLFRLGAGMLVEQRAATADDARAVIVALTDLAWLDLRERTVTVTAEDGYVTAIEGGSDA